MPEDGTVLTKETTDSTATTDGATKDTGATADKGTTQATDDSKKTGETTASTTETQEKKPEAVPEKYDLKLPKDSPLSADEVQKTADLAKALGLSQDKAQALLEARNQEHSNIIEGQREFMRQQTQAWGEAVTKDPEIAGKDGAEYQANIAYAKQVIGKFASPNMIKALNETGLGNHPELVRMMVRVGKAMRESSFHTGAATKGSENADPFQAAADKLYKPKEK